MNASLHMLTRVSHWQGVRPKNGTQRALVLFPQDAVPFTCKNDLPIYFHGSMVFGFERDERPPHEGGVKAVVSKYIYSLRIGADEPGEFVTWHWHPEVGGPPDPHVHVRGENGDVPGLRDMHVPTSRVFLEDVLLFAVRDLTARCRDEDTVALEKMRDRTRTWASSK